MVARIPPQPPGQFPIGHTLSYIRNPLGFLTQVARQHGDVVRLRLGFMTYYMVNDPGLVETILRCRDEEYIKDKLTRNVKAIVGEGLLTSEGEFWRRQRKLAQPAFLHQAIERYGDVMVEQTMRLRERLRGRRTCDIHQEIMALTLRIVAQTLFNAEVDEQAEEVGTLIEEMMTHFLNPLQWVPLRDWIPTPETRRFHRAVRRLDAIIYGMIAQRRASRDDPGDLLSRLLAAQDDEGAGMTDRQLRDECVTLFLAGHETTGLALTYTFWLLANHPEAETRLHAELDEVLADRVPTAADAPRLQYTEWVVREAMRLYPPAWSIGREATRDTELGGYHVPRGTQFIIAQWVLHRDPRWFDDPEAFRPERWENDLLKRLPRGAYIPFGDGPRICIGLHFAMLEAVLLLATLAQAFRFTSAPGECLVLAPSITLRPKSGTRMNIEPR